MAKLVWIFEFGLLELVWILDLGIWDLDLLSGDSIPAAVVPWFRFVAQPSGIFHAPVDLSLSFRQVPPHLRQG
jgi:hypothetical protein